MSAQPETWRVSTPEGIFEADLETLRQWIAEGAVLSTDKVSKGNLNWIEAGRAPMLRSAFNPQSSAPPPTKPSVAEPDFQKPEATNVSVNRLEENVDFPPPAHSTVSSHAAVRNAKSVCQNHPEVAAYYICRMCGATFCETCPRFVSNTPLCASCGDLCKVLKEERSKVVRQEFQGLGFGFSDFGRALRYPFQHKLALLFGAGMYGLLLLGGLKGQIVAYVVMFGCISHVISQVAWGRLNRSFMPDFSAFSMWDDFAVPIGLGIGITIVTWGPVIVLLLALFFGVISPAARSLTAYAPPAESQQPTVSHEDLSVLTDPEADPKKLEEANKKLEQTRPANQIAREAERSKQEESDPAASLRMLMPLLGAGIAILMILFVALLWGVFYYPMALTVAGYTQSFGSVINPLVGLDTIRRMGGTYFKAFGMVLLLQIAGLVVGIIVAMVTAPLALPFMGNLPAKFIDGSVTFYFNLVIACLLGLSLYKCADRLGISVD